MPDNKQDIGKPDRDRVNIHEPYEVRDWSSKLGVTPEQLKEAEKAVGPMVKDIRKHLGK